MLCNLFFISFQMVPCVSSTVDLLQLFGICLVFVFLVNPTRFHLSCGGGGSPLLGVSNLYQFSWHRLSASSPWATCIGVPHPLRGRTARRYRCPGSARTRSGHGLSLCGDDAWTVGRSQRARQEAGQFICRQAPVRAGSRLEHGPRHTADL